LDNKELLPEQFRQILRAGMNCKFTNDEFAAIFPLLENGGLVDGCEFILLFYRMRYEHRAKLLTRRVTIEKRHREQMKQMHEKHLEDLANKKVVDLVDDFTPEDEKAALEKIVEAAVKYDRMMPGAAPLDAFDADTINAGEFK
jgi:hypothetical protein